VKLLSVISPYGIIGYFNLYVAILLVAIVGYFIGGRCWLFYYLLLLVILFMPIGVYFIDGY